MVSFKCIYIKEFAKMILFLLICVLVIIVMLCLIVYTIATGQFHALPKELIIIAIPSLILLFLFKSRKKGDQNSETSEKVQRDTIKQLPKEERQNDFKVSSTENNLIICNDYNKAKKLSNSFVVFDLETTGLNPSCCEIIEIGAIKYIDGHECERLQTYIKPSKPIPNNITQINHITNEMVENSPELSEIIPKFTEFIGEYTLVAHNAPFDMKFIQTHLNNILGNVIQNPVVDTLPLARKAFPFLKNHKLTTIKDYLKMDCDSHNAIDDCLVTAELYLTAQAEKNRLKEIERKHKLEDANRQLKELEGTDVTQIEDKGYFYSNLGMLCENLGDSQKAIKYYELSVENDFEGKQPYQRLAVLYRKDKRFKDEINVCKKAMKLFYNTSAAEEFEKRIKTAESKLSESLK